MYGILNMCVELLNYRDMIEYSKLEYKYLNAR